MLRHFSQLKIFTYSRGPDRGIEPTPRKLAENQVFTPEARLREGKGHK